MSAPFISVVIPTYNASKFLREALDSLIAQTFTDWEAICVNDGSTDDSLAIMQEYAAKDSRFRILDGPNGGYGKAVNRGMDNAGGRYMAIFEPDDLLPRHAYRDLSETATATNADIVRGEECDFYDDEHKGRVIFTRFMNPCYGRIFTPTEEIAFFLSAQHSWTAIYRLDFLRKHHIRHNESPGASFQDTGIIFLSAAYAKQVICIKNITYLYRIDNPNSSVHNMLRKGNIMLDEYAFIRKKLESDGRWDSSLFPVFLQRYLIANLWLFQQLADELKEACLRRLRDELQEMQTFGTESLPPQLRREMDALLHEPERYLANYREQEKNQCTEWRHRGLIHRSWNNGHERAILLGSVPLYRVLVEPKIVRYFFLGLPLLKRIAYPVYTDYDKDFRYISANCQTFYVLGIPVHSRVTAAKEFRF